METKTSEKALAQHKCVCYSTQLLAFADVKNLYSVIQKAAENRTSCCFSHRLEINKQFYIEITDTCCKFFWKRTLTTFGNWFNFKYRTTDRSEENTELNGS